MRMVFIGPSESEDKYVHDIMQRRVAILSTQNDDSFGKEYTLYPGVREYHDFLQVLQNDIEPISEVAVVTHRSVTGKSEAEYLNGNYVGFRQLMDNEMPTMRNLVKQAINSEQGSLIHIDVGNDFSTLYFAYFCAIAKLSYVLTFHNPEQPEDAELPRVSFSLGGHSTFAKGRPMLRRHFAVDAIRYAERLFVSSDGIGAAMTSLFPKFPATYHLDPLSAQAVEKLSSQVA